MMFEFKQNKAFHMLQLVVHPALKHFSYGILNVYTSLGTVTTFSNVAHTYYCFRYTSYCVHNHVTLNHVYTPLHFIPINLTDLSNLAAKWRIKQAIACIFPVFFYLASSDFNFLFVFNLSNISSYTNSRYIHIVSVIVSIRTSRFSYIIYTFWWIIFCVLWFKNVKLNNKKGI